MHDLLTEFFPNLTYVFLYRQDRLRQAISFYRAKATNEWVRRADDASVSARVRYDRAQITRHMEALESMERQWRSHFAACNLQPLTLTYEQVVADRHATVEAVLEYLGIHQERTLLLPPGQFQRQADDLTDQWVERYRGGD